MATPYQNPRACLVANFEAVFDYDDYLTETCPTIAASMAKFASYLERELGIAIGGIDGVYGPAWGNGAGYFTAEMAIREQLYEKRRGEGETRRGELRRDLAGNAWGRERGRVEKMQRRRERVPSQDSAMVREIRQLAEQRETAKRGFRGEWGRFTRETMLG
ncbi:hypothetical protein SLS55_008241 [Diplodia seriata]|uniref:Uncharacterized protein n=1 Tax=Diplodia seriata TaxID=420778 RepID=A0ABR3C9X5_9PEZI